MDDIEQLAEQRRRLRDKDGRLVARYDGIGRPPIDPTFDRRAWAERIYAKLSPGERLELTPKKARALEQLLWWGSVRKIAGKRVRFDPVGDGTNGHVIYTPDGAMVARWLTYTVLP